MKLSSFLASLTLASATLAIAQTPPPSVPVVLGPSPNGPLAPICRLAVLNRDCTLYIDRRNPIARYYKLEICILITHNSLIKDTPSAQCALGANSLS